MPEYTKEQSRKMFLDNVRTIAKYWSKVEGRSMLEKCEGVAFSILSMMDGCNIGFPALDLALSPHPDDEDYLRGLGENWHKSGLVINDDVMLHDMFHNN